MSSQYGNNENNSVFRPSRNEYLSDLQYVLDEEKPSGLSKLDEDTAVMLQGLSPTVLKAIPESDDSAALTLSDKEIDRRTAVILLVDVIGEVIILDLGERLRRWQSTATGVPATKRLANVRDESHLWLESGQSGSLEATNDRQQEQQASVVGSSETSLQFRGVQPSESGGKAMKMRWTDSLLHQYAQCVDERGEGEAAKMPRALVQAVNGGSSADRVKPGIVAATTSQLLANQAALSDEEDDMVPTPLTKLQSDVASMNASQIQTSMQNAVSAALQLTIIAEAMELDSYTTTHVTPMGGGREAVSYPMLYATAEQASQMATDIVSQQKVCSHSLVHSPLPGVIPAVTWSDDMQEHENISTYMIAGLAAAAAEIKDGNLVRDAVEAASEAASIAGATLKQATAVSQKAAQAMSRASQRTNAGTQTPLSLYVNMAFDPVHVDMIGEEGRLEELAMGLRIQEASTLLQAEAVVAPTSQSVEQVIESEVLNDNRESEVLSETVLVQDTMFTLTGRSTQTATDIADEMTTELPLLDEDIEKANSPHGLTAPMDEKHTTKHKSGTAKRYEHLTRRYNESVVSGIKVPIVDHDYYEYSLR